MELSFVETKVLRRHD